MNYLKLLLLFISFSLPSFIYAENEKVEIPTEDKWGEKADGDRSLSNSPSLFKDANFVYAYSEKQLDNLIIGITDMQGNTYHYEVATIPAGMYYAISIEPFPLGQYYLCIYQGNNYIIGIFQK